MLRDQAEGKQKCDRIGGEEYVKKSYVSDKKIEDVRCMYKTRYGLLPFAGHYSHTRKFEKTNSICTCEKAREEERRIMSTHCHVYAHIRKQFSDLNKLLKYFIIVLAKRDGLDSLKE